MWLGLVQKTHENDKDLGQRPTKVGVKFTEILITGLFPFSLFWCQIFRNLTPFPGFVLFIVPSPPCT